VWRYEEDGMTLLRADLVVNYVSTCAVLKQYNVLRFVGVPASSSRHRGGLFLGVVRRGDESEKIAQWRCLGR
jgi:hypothetical protein